MTITTHWKLCEGVESAKTEYGAVLLDTTQGHYWQLNECGDIVVSGISNGKRISDIVAEITQTYEVSSEQAEADVLGVVRQLADASLIEQTNES